MIEGKGIYQLVLLHDDETRAVRKREFFVIVASEYFPSLVPGIYIDTDNLDKR